MDSPLLPGSTIGVFGSGQLGRMLALAARTLGYRIQTFAPDDDSPTGQVADREVNAPYDDLDAVRDFVRRVDVVTFEFENVAAAVAEVAEVAEEEGVPVRPGGWVLHTTQQRLREKEFLARAGLPVTPFAPVTALEGLTRGLRCLGTPCVLKTAAFGYDGKGQVRIDDPSAAPAAWDAIGRQAAILEAFVDFERELSVVAARGVNGSFAHWGVIENTTAPTSSTPPSAPAPVPARVAAEAVELARTILAQLEVVGVLCVEMFLDHRGHSSSTSWRRAPTTPATSPSTPPSPASSSSNYGQSAGCRWAPPTCTGRRRWPTCWAISGRGASRIGRRRWPCRV